MKHKKTSSGKIENIKDPDVLAQETVDNPEVALLQFVSIVDELEKEG